MTEDNRPKPYPLRMQPDVNDWIRERAERNERSVNVEINRVLRQMKEAEGAKNG
jgi:hypothetical protein